MSTPNYVLTEEHTVAWGYSSTDSKTLEAGSWIRPIELTYVPIHVKEDRKWSGTNKETHVFCYTRWGIMPIPREKVRQK